MSRSSRFFRVVLLLRAKSGRDCTVLNRQRLATPGTGSLREEVRSVKSFSTLSSNLFTHSCAIVLAHPQPIENAEKITQDAINIGRRPKWSESFAKPMAQPKAHQSAGFGQNCSEWSCSPRYESMYAKTTQYMSLKLSMCIAIVTRAVDTIVVSITEKSRPASMLFARVSPVSRQTGCESASGNLQKDEGRKPAGTELGRAGGDRVAERQVHGVGFVRVDGAHDHFRRRRG